MFSYSWCPIPFAIADRIAFACHVIRLQRRSPLAGKSAPYNIKYVILCDMDECASGEVVGFQPVRVVLVSPDHGSFLGRPGCRDCSQKQLHLQASLISATSYSGQITCDIRSVCDELDVQRRARLTPLAARIFRMGDEPTQRALAASQFLECSALTSMALEMRSADPSGSGFSANARLPAPRTFIETMIRGKRIGFACQEREVDGRVAVNCISEQDDGRIAIAWQAAFVPGSDEMVFGGQTSPSESKSGSAFAGLILVEKFLCIINQAGLADLRPRHTDKRVMRFAAERGIEVPQIKWHQCHIRPGIHGTGVGSVKAEHREHQLHYVRKHLKPSLGPDRWIDGYWRGNADLGIHLKSYIGHPH